MSLMSQELQKMAASKLRALLYKLTRNRLSGVLVGTILGFLIHSGATIVMMVSFINAGLMGLGQSIGVMLGTNLGTTLSMQLVSFNIAEFSYIAIFTGIMGHLTFRRDWLKHLSLILFGFGLLFLGMDIMKDAVLPFKSSPRIAALIQYNNALSVWGMISGIVLSSVFTILTQSSGATIGILFALGSTGIVTSLDQAFPAILGAHIGTCTIAIFGSIGTHAVAKRAALAHLVFNIVGSIFAALMYKFYAQMIPLTADDITRQIANTHTMVQAVNSLMLLPFVNQYARLITRITPSHKREPEKSHLDDRLLNTPEKAIVAALLELKRMSHVAQEMFQATMRGFLKISTQDFPYVRKSEEALDNLKEAINSFLITLAERNLSRRQSIILQYLMSATSDLERIGDHVENIAELTSDKIRRHIWFDDESVLDLIELYKKADGILGLLVISFEPSFYDSPSELATKILDLRNEYVAMSQKIKQKHNNLILEKKENPLNGIYYHRYVICLDKLVKHSKTIAIVEKEPFFFVKKHKLDRTTTKREMNGDTKHTSSITVDKGLFGDEDDKT